MSQVATDCANPFVRATNRQLKLLLSDEATISGQAKDDHINHPKDTHKHHQDRPSTAPVVASYSFTHPFIKVTNLEHQLQTGHALFTPTLEDATSVDRRPRHRRAEVLHRARRRYLNRRFRVPAKLRPVLPWAAASAAIYTLVFANEQAVMQASVGHWWSFLVPVGIAFAVSYAHGHFTAAFWEAVGLKPNTERN